MILGKQTKKMGGICPLFYSANIAVTKEYLTLDFGDAS